MERYTAIMPKSQKCIEELRNGKLEDKCRPAEIDYNGCGYWVCEFSYDRLNNQFDDEYQ